MTTTEFQRREIVSKNTGNFLTVEYMTVSDTAENKVTSVEFGRGVVRLMHQGLDYMGKDRLWFRLTAGDVLARLVKRNGGLVAHLAQPIVYSAYEWNIACDKADLILAEDEANNRALEDARITATLGRKETFNDGAIKIPKDISILESTIRDQYRAMNAQAETIATQAVEIRSLKDQRVTAMRECQKYDDANYRLHKDLENKDKLIETKNDQIEKLLYERETVAASITHLKKDKSELEALLRLERRITQYSRY